MRYLKYADPFHGSGTIDLPKAEGIAASWHFIKGLCGNNDSGGLSSCYVWNCLGLFPVSGQNRMFIGMPKFAGAALQLSNGRTLVIRRTGNGRYPVSASLNGMECTGLMLSASEMMNGGELIIRTEG